MRLEFPATLVKVPEPGNRAAHAALPPTSAVPAAELSSSAASPNEDALPEPALPAETRERNSPPDPARQRPAAGTEMATQAERLAAISRALAESRRAHTMPPNPDTTAAAAPSPALRGPRLDAASLRRRLAHGDAS